MRKPRIPDLITMSENGIGSQVPFTIHSQVFNKLMIKNIQQNYKFST